MQSHVWPKVKRRHWQKAVMDDFADLRTKDSWSIHLLVTTQLQNHEDLFVRKGRENEEKLLRSCISHPVVCELCHRHGHCTSHLHFDGSQCLIGAGRSDASPTPMFHLHDGAQHERIITIESCLSHGYASPALKSCLRRDTSCRWIL